MPDLRRTPEPLPRAGGWAVFGVLVVFVAAGSARRLPEQPLLATAALVVAVGVGAVAIFGRAAFILPAAAISSAAIAVLANGVASNVAWFGIAVLAAWCALSAPLAVTATYWFAAIVLLTTEYLVTSRDPGWAAWIGGTTFSVVGCLFGRRQRELVVQLREAQAGLTLRAQAEERNRIARELHDVIAHSLTISLLHVSSARLALADDPADAERALAEAERLGRASLDEVRHAVGLLHRHGSLDPTAPLPGSTDVPSLLEGFRAAGADVRATVDGDLDALPATVGLAAYRILQEALTNAARHAPAQRATVHITVTADAVLLDVDSAGAPGRGNGLGLVGMRERAESLGGTFEAGPGGSGWRVHAELPLTTEAVR
ncbi:MAG: hypothetical protein QOJ78_2029 [Pseudonocardiales bacterium]|nr:hypothetical protein [Pseudonocardiales bacterium]MDT4930572.1 hypothetical protein [Pseudonocardiales bacterium]